MAFRIWLKKLLGITLTLEEATYDHPGSITVAIHKPTPALALEPVKPTDLIRGVDVYHGQAGLDWALVKQLGYKFAFAKAIDGQGPSQDSAFTYHRAGAKKAGIPLGAYMFLRFGMDPILQAEYFFKTVGGVQSGELGPVIDIEWDRYVPKYSDGYHMDDAAADHAHQVLNRVELLFQVTPMIYTNPNFLTGFSYPERFMRFPLWTSAYHTTAEKLKMPPSHKNTGWRFWQYADDVTIGKVKAVDVNYFHGSQEQLNALVKP